MKTTCVKCGAELEVKFGIQTNTNCKGEFILIQITCTKCDTLNECKRLLGEKADTKKVDEFLSKNYIG